MEIVLRLNLFHLRTCRISIRTVGNDPPVPLLTSALLYPPIHDTLPPSATKSGLDQMSYVSSHYQFRRLRTPTSATPARWYISSCTRNARPLMNFSSSSSRPKPSGTILWRSSCSKAEKELPQLGRTDARQSLAPTLCVTSSQRLIRRPRHRLPCDGVLVCLLVFLVG